MVYIFISKTNWRMVVYGSLKALFDAEKEFIQRSKQTLYNSHDFDIDDYEDELCKICQRFVKRSKSNFL